MGGRSIVVDRRKKLGWAARLYLPTMLRGLAVTARRLSGGLRGSTPRYPEIRSEHPDAFRGMPVLVAREDGSPRCVACGQCALACPTRCIHILPADGAEQGSPPERFDVDMSRCIFCGFCEDACSDEAIVMSSLVELATADPAALLWELETLLVPAELLSRRLGFLGGTAGAGEPAPGRQG